MWAFLTDIHRKIPKDIMEQSNMSEWIKSSEKMPEEDGEYLTYWIDNGCTFGMDVQRFFKKPRTEEGMYRNCYLHWEKQTWDDYCVTHWMPLPSIPDQ